MNKTAIAILGSVSAVALAGGAQASTAANPSAEFPKPARSFAELLDPMPNAAAVLEAYGPGGVQVYPHGGGGGCRELRAACMHKRELGKSGQGNCARYRGDVRGRGRLQSSSSLARG